MLTAYISRKKLIIRREIIRKEIERNSKSCPLHFRTNYQNRCIQNIFPTDSFHYFTCLSKSIARAEKSLYIFKFISPPLVRRSVFPRFRLRQALKRPTSRETSGSLGTRGYESNEARGSRATLFTAATTTTTTTTTLSPEGYLRILRVHKLSNRISREKERKRERISRAKRLVKRGVNERGEAYEF